MKRIGLRNVVWAACLGVPACVERPLDDAETGQTTSADAETSGVPTSGTSSASSGSGAETGTGAPEPGTATSMTPEPGSTAGPDTGGDTSTGCDFICNPTDDNPSMCDVFAQNCPEGEKCAAYADDGGSTWNANKCVPVMGSGQHGDACTVTGGGVSGLDDCVKGVMCWGVDPETSEGNCIALCTGTVEAPVCPVNSSCKFYGGGVLNVCIPRCNPLTSPCPGDDLCIPTGDDFTCVLDASGEEGQRYDPCEYANACDQGLFCADPANAGMCDPNATGCCLQFCDITKEPTPCTDDLQCITWWVEGESVPPDLANIGACIIGA